MFDKISLGYFSLFLVVLGGAPYLWSILANKTKPHAFTWLVWTLITAIAAAAQFAGHAGPGAWGTALTAALCSIILVLAFTWRGERTYTRGDWISLVLALSSIPLWYLTKSALVASIAATGIDVLAYYPNFRKSWAKPHEEMIVSYVITNLKHLISIMATVEYSVTTLVYPVTIFTVNAALVVMLTLRRARLKRAITD